MYVFRPSASIVIFQPGDCKNGKRFRREPTEGQSVRPCRKVDGFWMTSHEPFKYTREGGFVCTRASYVTGLREEYEVAMPTELVDGWLPCFREEAAAQLVENQAKKKKLNEESGAKDQNDV